MNFSRFKKQDFIMTTIMLVLMLLGSLIIYATTYNTAESDLIYKQIILIIAGLVVYFLLTMVDLAWVQVFSLNMIAYAVIVLTLLYVNFLGSTIAGTNRWIDFGFFSFQPSEYAKIIIILLTALFFSSDLFRENEKVREIKAEQTGWGIKSYLKLIYHKVTENRDLKIVLLSALFAAPILILTFIQPALGNTIIILVIWLLTMLFALEGQITVIRIVVLLGVVLAAVAEFISFNIETTRFVFNYADWQIINVLAYAVFAVLFLLISKAKIPEIVVAGLLGLFLTFSFVFTWNNLLDDYQHNRLLSFVSGPESDPLGSGYQVIQSKIAIGSGRLLGRGYLQGTQSSLHILTQAQTDFAFAALSEQFGFVGSAMLLLIYLALLLRIIKIAKETKSQFGRIICFGAVNLLLCHLFINVGMNLGRLPVTGIPLPLISYGGSSVLMTTIILGLVQSVYVSRKPVDMADSLVLTSL